MTIGTGYVREISRYVHIHAHQLSQFKNWILPVLMFYQYENSPLKFEAFETILTKKEFEYNLRG